MKNYKVYKLQNMFNKKIYVGQTERDTIDRWKDGKRNYNEELKSDIEKYGWENFSKEIVSEGLSSKDADTLEKNLIETLDLLNPIKGYNKTSGGKRFESISEDTKIKISKSIKKSSKFKQNNRIAHIKKVIGIEISTGKIVKFQSLKDAGNYFNISPSAIGNVCRGRIKTAKNYVWRFDDENFKGFNYEEIKNIKKLSEETRRKISENHKKKNIFPEKAINSVKKPVIGVNIKTNEIVEFESGAEAERKLGINHVNSVCKGKRKQSGGFIWKYKE